jgi:hypothetical protein
VRDNVTKWWSENAYKSFIVDTRSGAMKFGDGQVIDWFVEQTKVDGNWDFVASSSDTRGRRVAADRIQLRVSRDKEPVQFILVVNGFAIYTGTCEEVY